MSRAPVHILQMKERPKVTQLVFLSDSQAHVNTTCSVPWATLSQVSFYDEVGKGWPMSQARKLKDRLVSISQSSPSPGL